MNNYFKQNDLRQLMIGMRTIKTALAVGLCVAVAQALQLEYPFYAAIAAIISMGNSLTNSLAAGKNRIMGTMAGALIGLLFASIQPNNALLCGLGIVLLFWICNVLKWSASIPIAGIVFMAIMVNLRDQTPLFYSLNRILDTVIGISIALIVNLVFCPHDRGVTLEQRLKILVEQTSALIIQIIGRGEAGDLGPLQKTLADLHTQLTIHANELKIKKVDLDCTEPVGQALKIYQDIHLHLKVVQTIDGAKCLNAQNCEELNRRYGLNLQTQALASESSSIVYNYHVGRIIAGLQSLEK